MKHYLTLDQYIDDLRHELNDSFSLTRALEPFGLGLTYEIDDWEDNLLFGLFIDELHDRMQDEALVDPFDVAIIAQDLGVGGAKEFISEYSLNLKKLLRP